MITFHIKIKIVSLSLFVYFLFFKAPRKKDIPIVPHSLLLLCSLHSKDDTTNKKMTKSSNNKIACIFEDINAQSIHLC